MQNLGIGNSKIASRLIRLHPESVIRSRAFMLGLRGPYIFLTSVILTLAHSIVYPKLNSMKGLREMRNSLGDIPVLVIANGSSAEQLDWSRIRSLQKKKRLAVIAMNAFHGTEGARHIVPDFYVLSDPLHNLARSPESAASVWRYLQEKKITAFVPYHWLRGANHIFRGSPLIQFDDRAVFTGHRANPAFPRPYLSLTSMKAMDIANYLTSGKIFISGVDNSSFLGVSLGRDGNVYQSSRHAKGGSTQIEFFQVVPTGRNGIADYFFSVAQVSWAYRRYFKNMNIYNLSNNSFVDAFEFADDLQLLKKVRDQSLE